MVLDKLPPPPKTAYRKTKTDNEDPITLKQDHKLRPPTAARCMTRADNRPSTAKPSAGRPVTAYRGAGFKQTEDKREEVEVEEPDMQVMLDSCYQLIRQSVLALHNSNTTNQKTQEIRPSSESIQQTSGSGNINQGVRLASQAVAAFKDLYAQLERKGGSTDFTSTVDDACYATYVNLAGCLSVKGNVEDALKVYSLLSSLLDKMKLARCVETAGEESISLRLGKSYVNVANCYVKLDKISLGIRYYHMALDLFPRDYGWARSLILRNLGIAQFRRMNYMDAWNANESIRTVCNYINREDDSPGTFAGSSRSNITKSFEEHIHWRDTLKNSGISEQILDDSACDLLSSDHLIDVINSVFGSDDNSVNSSINIDDLLTCLAQLGVKALSKTKSYKITTNCMLPYLTEPVKTNTPIVLYPKRKPQNLCSTLWTKSGLEDKLSLVNNQQDYLQLTYNSQKTKIPENIVIFANDDSSQMSSRSDQSTISTCHSLLDMLDDHGADIFSSFNQVITAFASGDSSRMRLALEQLTHSVALLREVCQFQEYKFQLQQKSLTRGTKNIIPIILPLDITNRCSIDFIEPSNIIDQLSRGSLNAARRPDELIQYYKSLWDEVERILLIAATLIAPALCCQIDTCSTLPTL